MLSRHSTCSLQTPRADARAREGEMVRLLEFEELHHAARALPNVVVVGDFNAASRLGAGASELHSRLARATDECAMLRSAKACRRLMRRIGRRLDSGRVGGAHVLVVQGSGLGSALCGIPRLALLCAMPFAACVVAAWLL